MTLFWTETWPKPKQEEGVWREEFILGHDVWGQQ